MALSLLLLWRIRLIISEQESNRLLLNRKAGVVLALAAVLSAVAIYISQSALDWWRVNHQRWELLSCAAATAAVDSVVLLVGMWLFWVKCDKSSKRSRGVWFFVLLLGMTFGAIPYYLFVYLPAVRMRLKSAQGGRGV
jgi:hypothetical protein